jgi:hypothetical protein
MVTPAAGDGRMRAAHTDRERVVDALKAAFIQGRLTQDELDTRVGQALAARTYADLAVLTADLPALTTQPARTPEPAPAQPPNQSARKAVKSGAIVVGGIILIMSGTAFVLGQPAAAVALAVFFTVLAAVSTALVAGIIATALKVEARHQNRTRGQLPPGPASGPHGQEPASRPAADRDRQSRRRPHGSLAVRPAGVSGSPALPPSGRTDRRLAAGYGPAQPGGLVLAGPAGRLR